MMEDFKIPPYLRQILVLAVIFVAIIGLKYTAPILGLILLSIFLEHTDIPLFDVAEKKRVFLQPIGYSNPGGDFCFRCGHNRFSSGIISRIVKTISNYNY